MNLYGTFDLFFYINGRTTYIKAQREDFLFVSLHTILQYTEQVTVAITCGFRSQTLIPIWLFLVGLKQVQWLRFTIKGFGFKNPEHLKYASIRHL